MAGMRDFLRGVIQPQEVEQVSGSARLAQHVRGWRQYEQERDEAKAAEAAEAAKPPPPATLVDELKALIGEPELSDVPGLADSRLLEIAAQSQEAPRSVREQISSLLRSHWDQREPGTDQ